MEPSSDSQLVSQRLAAIVDSSDDAIISKDLHSTIMTWNASAERVFGYTASEMIGASIMRLIPAERRAEEVEILSRIRRGERVDHFETERMRKDGSLIYVSITVSPIKNAEGVIVGASKIARDISGQIAAQEQLRRAASERQRLLEREQAARADAEKANRVKDDFLATLSHELRTPLNAILGWSSLLTGGKIHGEELMQALRTIERNARAQAQIISDLLDMSSIVSGKVQLDMRQLDLGRSVSEAVETMRAAAAVKEIRLEMDTDASVRNVSGDPSRLQQIFWNLLTNAVKFTPKGGTVRLSVESTETHAIVRVTDSGEGIGKDFLAVIFERFEQADTSITRRHGGLGLGLAIVKQLAELHGGRVWAESEGQGKGASFYVELPLIDRSPKAQKSALASGKKNRSAAETPLAGLHVLVVDDDEDGRRLVERLLDEAGAVVLGSCSAAEAMDVLLAEPVDLLVCDVGMPDEDGYSLIRRVRALADRTKSAVPAVALTAYARLEDRTEAIRAGFQNHIAKPLDVGELMTVVQNLAMLRTGSDHPIPA